MADKKHTVESKEMSEFPIVGIGASAGGLKATETFLKNVPPDSGMAFVLVFHLDPRHKSEAAELLQGHTAMPVMQIEGSTPVEPNHVYVIPPDHGLALRDGALELSELVRTAGHPTVIDRFFRSLATEAGEHAIGVVLSGTGTEGSQGLKAIKEAGGISMVQEESEAEYGGMPHSAIATGLIDLVLPVAKMGEKLVELKGSTLRLVPPDEDGKREDDAEILQKIFVQLRTQTRHDFSHYKQNTVLRRITRRMQMRQLETLEAYLQTLRTDPAETAALFRELLISVTNFFRDPASFEALDEKVVPEICAKRHEGDTVRIWVPGCATGEEAYSLAMLLREACDGLASPPKLQIFATDVDEHALDTGRRGLYPDSIAGDVSAARLKRFFTLKGSSYEVTGELREMILFAKHDLLRDPPFSKLDLISCRNLLIYLDTEMQTRVFELFHFALKASGYLFLGSSESLGETRKMFGDLDRKAKLFSKKRVANADVHFPLLPGARKENRPRRDASAKQAPPSFQDMARQQLLTSYAPPCAIVDENYDVVYISGRVGKYLEPSAGAPSQNILDMARKGLGLELRAALYRAGHGGESTIARHVNIKANGDSQLIALTVRPLEEAEDYLLVVFETIESGAAPEPSVESDDDIALQLERELKNTQESLQTSIEELETSNEELRASNEELQSVNEELQSTTEELETGKEELQSTNEELIAVNQELQSKNDELARTNADLNNFIASTEIGTLFLDEELRVRRYTPRLADIFNLIASDVGRPLAHLTHNLETEDLVADATRVLRDLAVVEKELAGKNGNYYQTRLRPYRATDNKIGGVVATFVDVSERHRHEEQTQALNARLEAQKTYAESIIATVREPMLILDDDLRAVSASRAFYRDFATTQQAVENTLLYELGDGQWDSAKLRRLLEKVLPQHTTVDDFEVRHDFGAGERVLLLNARRMQQGEGSKPLVLLVFEDITERKRAEEHRQFLLDELNHRVKNTLATVQSIAMQTFVDSPAHAERVWRFESRLMALAKTHNLLASDNWGDVSLHSLLERELAPFGGDGGRRLATDGDDVLLRPNAALTLGLAFHELATNAVKYGALSNAEGRVAIVSELLNSGKPRLRLTWTETGGPDVQKPTRRGFGSRLVSGGLTHELSGKVRMDYRTEGFVCTMEIPLPKEDDHDNEKR